MTWEIETERERGPEAGEMGERRPGGVTLSQQQQQHQQSWGGWPNWKRPGGVRPVEPAPPSQSTNEGSMNGVPPELQRSPLEYGGGQGHALRVSSKNKLNLAAETVPWNLAGSHIVHPSYKSPEPECQAF